MEDRKIPNFVSDTKINVNSNSDMQYNSGGEIPYPKAPTLYSNRLFVDNTLFEAGNEFGRQEIREQFRRNRNEERTNYLEFEGGICRVKGYSDGEYRMLPILGSNIDIGKQFEVLNKRFISLRIKNGYDYIETEVFDIENLKDTKFIEMMIAKYCVVSDLRAYHGNFIARLQNIIYGKINAALPPKKITVGWNQCGNDFSYCDGNSVDFEKIPNLVTNLIKPDTDAFDYSCDVYFKNCIQKEILCMVILLSVFSVFISFFRHLNSVPVLLLYGEVADTYNIMDSLLLFKKMDGVSLISSIGDLKHLLVSELRDDVIGVNAYDVSRKRECLLELAGGRTFFGSKIASTVAIATKDANVVEGFDVVSIDCEELEEVENVGMYLNQFKNFLIYEIENKNFSVEVLQNSKVVAITDAIKLFVEWLTAYCMKCSIPNLLTCLQNGMAYYLKKRKGSVLLELFCQHLRSMIRNKRLAILSADEVDKSDFCGIIEKQDFYYIRREVFYFILNDLGFNSKDGTRIKEDIMKQGLLKTYVSKKAEKTVDLYLPKLQKTISVYGINIKLFR